MCKVSINLFLLQNPDIKWSTRWDFILDSTYNSGIHWFSIFNSCVVVLFVSCMLMNVMLRTLCKDFVRRNQLENAVRFSFHSI